MKKPKKIKYCHNEKCEGYMKFKWYRNYKHVAVTMFECSKCGKKVEEKEYK